MHDCKARNVKMDQQQRPASQKLPAGLAGMLNSPEDHRDSAYYSGTDASSKHTSAASGLGVLSPPVSGFQTSPIDKTPSPTTTNLLPQPLISPINSNMSVASMVSPTTPSSADPRRFDRPQSLDSAPRSATFVDGLDPMSRRESVDSNKLNQGLTDMRLGASPYASHNHSTTSIHNTHNAMLQQQRVPRPSYDAVSRISNGYQPERKPERIAPAITGPATSQIARAAEPTKGQAWAFPEEDIKHIPSNPRDSLHDASRRSSFASLASSQYTTESRLPPGQRRLDDAMDYQHQRLSTASAEYGTVHHHSIHNKHLSGVQNEELGHGGQQPYSRTPELRVSHKLAERKRRTEMKELFEQLRDLMPQERGSKASKWEILTKAIAEHNKQSDVIRNLQQQSMQLQAENEMLRRELMQRGGPPQPMAGPYQHDQFARQQRGEELPLPPLRNLAQPAPSSAAPESMSGIQYGGYRPPDQQPRF